jgi:hypothetical protein
VSAFVISSLRVDSGIWSKPGMDTIAFSRTLAVRPAMRW